jgi:hypothetical protein
LSSPRPAPVTEQNSHPRHFPAIRSFLSGRIFGALSDALRNGQIPLELPGTILTGEEF